MIITSMCLSDVNIPAGLPLMAARLGAVLADAACGDSTVPATAAEAAYHKLGVVVVHDDC